MRLHRLALLALVVFATGCAAAAATNPPAPCNCLPNPALTAIPSAVTFPLPGAIPTPAPVELDGIGAFSGPFTVSVADPTQVGASLPVIVRLGVATMSLVPISSGTPGAGPLGTTTVTIADAQLAATTLTVTQTLCGRPDNLLPASSLIFPRQGTTGNAATGTTAYVAVQSHVPPATVALHVIVGTNGTLEAGAMQPATPPPGAAPLPFTPVNVVTTVLAAPLPTLPAGATIRLQIYDDTCQPPIVVGSLST